MAGDSAAAVDLRIKQGAGEADAFLATSQPGLDAGQAPIAGDRLIDGLVERLGMQQRPPIGAQFGALDQALIGRSRKTAGGVGRDGRGVGGVIVGTDAAGGHTDSQSQRGGALEERAAHDFTFVSTLASTDMPGRKRPS